MGSLHKRIERLEQQAGISSTVPEIQRAVDDIAELRSWLADRGFSDAKAAIAAGERGPSGLSIDLHLLAAVDIEIERGIATGPVPIKRIEFVMPPEEDAKYRALPVEDLRELRRIRARMDGEELATASGNKPMNGQVNGVT